MIVQQAEPDAFEGLVDGGNLREEVGASIVISSVPFPCSADPASTWLGHVGGVLGRI